jgi:hypothetical protein
MAMIIRDKNGNVRPFGPDPSELIPGQIEAVPDDEAERLKQTPSNMLAKPVTAPIEPVIRKPRR